ncbi:MAG TPA: CHAT domain-containing protein [Pyrinomonadaceae bacterium]
MIRILLLAANPLHTSRLALEAEHRLLRNRMTDNLKMSNCELLVEWAARLKDVKERLATYQPHVVHFAGHGTESGICLEDDEGQCKTVEKEELAELFKSAGGDLQLVVLNACYSVLQSDAIRESVKYVVGTTAPVADDAAVYFAAHFYEELALGKSVRDAHYKSQLALISDMRAPRPRYELLVRADADTSQPLLPPMAPPKKENITRAKFNDAKFGRLELINSDDGDGEENSMHSETNFCEYDFRGSTTVKTGIFTNHKKTRR